MLSQAEHDEAAQSIVTDDAEFADQVALAVDHMLPKLERAMLRAVHGQIMGRLLPYHHG